MAINDLRPQERTAEGHEIERRDARALTEYMTVLDRDPRVRGADGLYIVVSPSGREYLIDAFEGVCECPDFQHNLPTPEGRRTCKHLARVTYATGMRPLPAWIDHDAVDPQLGLHVSGGPRGAGGALATDGAGGKR